MRGAEGNDVLDISDISFRQLAGGRGIDTLRLDDSGITLDLTNIADNKVTGIEQIDITGSGSNVVTLDLLEVLNVSDTSSTLVVIGDGDDTAEVGDGWSESESELIDGDSFTVFTQGSAVLKISELIEVAGSGQLSVYVDSIEWNDEFRDIMDGNDDGNIGVPGVPVEASQLLMWPDLSRIIVDFSESMVDVTVDDVQVCGVSGPSSIAAGSFTTGEVDVGGKTVTRAMWELDDPLVADKLKLVLSDAVGGDELEFVVLVGDVNMNSSVNLGDAFQVFNNQDDPEYVLTNDLDGNSTVNLVDVFSVVANLDVELPSGDADCSAGDAASDTTTIVSTVIANEFSMTGFPGLIGGGQFALPNDYNSVKQYAEMIPEDLTDNRGRTLPPRLVEEIFISDNGILDFVTPLVVGDDDKALLQLAGITEAIDS